MESLPSDWHFSGKLIAAYHKPAKCMSALEKPVYRFQGFELEPSERRLSEGGRPISLTPKVFDTLVLLVERAGQVVSKDELMRALWPRGFVEESNLTKHIWFIRRALGDREQDSHFIETVPKAGYRFIAPVTVGVSPVRGPAPAPASEPLILPSEGPATSSAPIPAVPTIVRPSKTRRLIWIFGGIAALTVAGLVGAYWMGRQVPVPRHAGRTVAVVGFSNLSRNAKDAWLGPALSEMLATELTVTNDVQVVPDELVRNASADLTLPVAGGFSVQTLARLRRRLDADYVITGSYLVTGSSDVAPLRLDLALQDTHSGGLVGSFSSHAELSSLIALVSHEGNALRAKLGAASPGPATLGLIANAQPPSVDVARRIGFALDALQHYDPARARDELLEAIAEAPGYAPAYMYLSQAWSGLGYRDKALAAAEQAAQHATNLPVEQQLQVEAVRASVHAEWPKAVEAWKKLSLMNPRDLEYRLQIIDAQINGGATAEAQTSLRELQQQPHAAADPRLELAAARLALALNDAKGSEHHAAGALQWAQQRDATGFAADAQRALGTAETLLNQNEEARSAFNAAIGAYREIRNPRGEAAARAQLAYALSNLDRNQEAREEYQRAMTLDQSIGDLGGVANVYRQLSNMLWLSGDRDGAQAAARHSLALARETGDLSLQSWTIQALATIESDDAASDEVLQEYREVVSLYQRAGHPTAWTLTNIADVQRMRGELAAAAVTCAQAQREAATLTDPQFAIFSGFTCALIAADRGDAKAARGGFEEVIRRVGAGGNMTYTDNSQMMLAQLDMDEGHWKEARKRLQGASQGFAAAEERTGEADAQAMLALCEEVLGDPRGREQALSRAQTLRASITSRQEVYIVDIALARLGAKERTDGTNAVDRLLVLAEDAERRHFTGWSLEAKLAAWEVQFRQLGGSSSSLRNELADTARRHGFGRILRRLENEESH
jgi:DNA-binding winged helix-turn-helix (wHTH) protein/tetratricopeptide (TPR) repeat protein